MHAVSLLQVGIQYLTTLLLYGSVNEVLFFAILDIWVCFLFRTAGASHKHTQSWTCRKSSGAYVWLQDISCSVVLFMYRRTSVEWVRVSANLRVGTVQKCTLKSTYSHCMHVWVCMLVSQHMHVQKTYFTKIYFTTYGTPGSKSVTTSGPPHSPMHLWLAGNMSLALAMLVLRTIFISIFCQCENIIRMST